jgi:transcriptional regulator with XRE-family HTH domain
VHRWVLAGDWARSQRTRLGWSQGDVARAAGVSVTIVHKIEKGDGGSRRPASLARVSVALGYTPQSLYDFGTKGIEPIHAGADLGPGVLRMAATVASMPPYRQRFVDELIRWLSEEPVDTR